MTHVKTNTSKALDHVTPADLERFKKASKNANYFTDYYVRTASSGTYWKKTPEPYDDDKAKAWIALWQAWKQEGQSKSGFLYKTSAVSTYYHLQWDENGDPVFHHHHGWLWQNWQLQMHHCPQREVTVIGGMGVGKTAAETMSLITMACTIPNFRGFAIAPKMLQTTEVYNYIRTWCSDTVLFDRWLKSAAIKPYPKFVFQNDYISESSIELYSIEKNPEKVLTLEGDAVFVDQAEQFEDLDTINTMLGTRLRGQVHGRSRLGKMVYIANAAPNPELWYRYDLAEHEPETYLSLNPSTYDNIYLTKSQIKDMERRVGGTNEQIEQRMKGKRPMGQGQHFPAHVVQLCLDEGLDNIMDAQYKDPDVGPLPGYIRRSKEKVGIYDWELPPDRGRTYCVIADVGQSNPPDRNSPVIMVWDISDFPGKPAVMRAFHWVEANGSYWPFVNEYERLVKLYRAQGMNGFDATGTQKGFDELVFAVKGLEPEGINLGGAGKYHALNAAKLFLGKGLMKFPYIQHLVNQLTHYTLPDTKLRQDLVMCIAMTALYIRRFYWEDVPDEEEIVPERNYTGSDRYSRSSSARHTRQR